MHPGRWKPSCFPGNLPYSRRNICCRISSLRRDLGTPPDARDRTSKQAETLRFRPRSTPFGGCADGVLAAHFPSRSSAFFRVRIRPNAFVRFVTGIRHRTSRRSRRTTCSAPFFAPCRDRFSQWHATRSVSFSGSTDRPSALDRRTVFRAAFESTFGGVFRPFCKILEGV